MDTNNIIIYIACICFLFICGRIFILPIKSILKLVLNTCIGALMIYLINVVGGIWGVHIGLNYVTAIFTGILGVPRSNFTCDSKPYLGDIICIIKIPLICSLFYK